MVYNFPASPNGICAPKSTLDVVPDPLSLHVAFEELLDFVYSPTQNSGLEWYCEWNNEREEFLVKLQLHVGRVRVPGLAHGLNSVDDIHNNHAKIFCNGNKLPVFVLPNLVH